MKRLIDILLTLFAIPFLAPIFLLASLIIAWDSRGPIIFWSKRVGKNNNLFWMPKFRTMSYGAPLVPTDKILYPEVYITRVGRFLRKTSIDELPQLYCVIVGTMSLVGPRPVLPSQKTFVAKRNDLNIFSLRPGITGWAQINGRDGVSDAEKLKLDLEYLKNYSIGFDLQILCRTVTYVLGRKGVRH